MSDNTKIEWADATVNAVNGCTRVSPGCVNCYAERLAATRLRDHPSRPGLAEMTSGGPRWTGKVTLHEPALLQPLQWTKPRRIFWNAHGDLFHDAVRDEWIDRVMAVCALTPQHTHMILTKRAKRMREYMTLLPDVVEDIAAAAGSMMEDGDGAYSTVIQLMDKPLPNVWLGVSVEDQTRADERIPDLLATPAAVRFLSCEPLLGPVDLRWIAEPDEDKDGVIDALLGCNWIADGRGEEFRPVRPGHQDRVMRRWVCSTASDILANRKLDWVIAGGESGPGARPMHPDWARSLRDQCAAAGVPFHFKQWGEWGHAFHLEGCFGVSAATTGTGHWPEPKRYRIQGGPFDGVTAVSHPDDHLLLRIGKKRAGRLLDGVEYNGLPV